MRKIATQALMATLCLSLLATVQARAADAGASRKAPAAGAMGGQGMMPGMMGQGQGMMGAEMMSGGKQASGMMGGCMMPGGMMGQGMMGGGMMSGMMPGMMASDMMGTMMGGMMPGKVRGCMMMAEGMMMGQLDLARMHKALGLSDEQADKMRMALRPLQKEAILSLASLKIAELELADLLSEGKTDFGKIEAKLKETEVVRTRLRLAHLKAADAVKGLLTKEQLEKLQEAAEPQPAPASSQPQPASQKSDAPEGAEGHEAHH